MKTPEWTNKFKQRGVYVGKNKYGYYLYKAHCVRDPITKKPKTIVDEYLGMISEEEGFIPKQSKVTTSAIGIEYGLSHFIYSNFKNTLKKQMTIVDGDIVNTMIVTGIVNFTLDSTKCLSLSYLTVSNDILSLPAIITPRRLQLVEKLKNIIANEIKIKLPASVSYEYFCCKLRNILAFKSKNGYEFMSLDAELQEIITKSGWIFE